MIRVAPPPSKYLTQSRQVVDAFNGGQDFVLLNSTGVPERWTDHAVTRTQIEQLFESRVRVELANGRKVDLVRSETNWIAT